MFTLSVGRWLRFELFLGRNSIIRKFIRNLCHSERIKSCRISFELEISWTMGSTGLSAVSYCSQAFPNIFHPRDWSPRYFTKKFVCWQEHPKWSRPKRRPGIRETTMRKKSFLTLNLQLLLTFRLWLEVWHKKSFSDSRLEKTCPGLENTKTFCESFSNKFHSIKFSVFLPIQGNITSVHEKIRKKKWTAFKHHKKTFCMHTAHAGTKINKLWSSKVVREVEWIFPYFVFVWSACRMYENWKQGLQASWKQQIELCPQKLKKNWGGGFCGLKNRSI